MLRQDVCYAIMQKSTGFFLPYRRSKRGYTHTEPIDNCIPRLFKKKVDAKRALEYWLCGKETWQYTGDTLGYSEDWSIVTTKVDTRKAEDMEVVGIILNMFSLFPPYETVSQYEGGTTK